MNKVTLTGRTTADIELRHTQTGKTVGSFTIAVDGRKGADGNRSTDFFDCTVWEKTAESMEKWVRKGTKILVEGEIHNEKWKDRDGNNRVSTKLWITYWEFCDSKSEPTAQEKKPVTDKDGFMKVDVSDDELPFL